MRVADINLQSNYINNNSSSLDLYSKLANKVLTQKAFTRASQDPVNANKAMKLRKRMQDLDTYDVNLKNASSLFTDAETNLNHISTTLYNTISTKLISIQSTKSDVEFSAIGEEICQQAEAMVNAMNADSGQRMIFAGTSNNKEPFTFKYFECDEKGDITTFDPTDLTDPDKIVFGTEKNSDGVECQRYTDVNGNDVLIPTSITDLAADLHPVTGDSDTPKGYVKYVYGADPAKPDGKVFIKEGIDPAKDLYEAPRAEYEAVALRKDKDGNTIFLSADGTGEITVSEKDMKDPDKMKDLSKQFAYRKEAGINATLTEKRAIVYYNGMDVNLSTDPYSYPGTESGIYIDIGIGIKYDEKGDVIKSTALDIALNGTRLTGCGVDENGDSKNLLQLAFDSAWAAYNADGEKAYKEGDTTIKGYANRLIDKLSGGQKTVLEGITELGVKQNNITFHLDKDRDYRLNLSEVQNDTEGINIAEEITKELAAQAAYNACLSLGSTAVPQSIFNYI